VFELSFAEIAVIFVVAVLVIGPKELPTIMRAVSKGMRQLREVASQFRRQFDLLDENGEMAKLQQELREQATFIENERGEVFRSYDISDLLKERQKPEQVSDAPAATVGEPANDSVRGG